MLGSGVKVMVKVRAGVGVEVRVKVRAGFRVEVWALLAGTPQHCPWNSRTVTHCQPAIRPTVARGRP